MHALWNSTTFVYFRLRSLCTVREGLVVEHPGKGLELVVFHSHFQSWRLHSTAIASMLLIRKCQPNMRAAPIETKTHRFTQRRHHVISRQNGQQQENEPGESAEGQSAESHALKPPRSLAPMPLQQQNNRTLNAKPPRSLAPMPLQQQNNRPELS